MPALPPSANFEPRRPPWGRSRSKFGDLGDLAELVRLPAVLSVPGDTLLGAVAADGPLSAGRVAGQAAASACLYLGGMALNDYADRDVDAVERPHRPIPSGRVDPKVALRLAQALTAGGVAIAGLVGGRKALRVAVPLAATVWAYDLALKDTPAGPAAMAACRGLDVLLGASAGNLRPALAPAAVVTGHTLAVTLVSQHEAQGGTPAVARRSLWSTAAVTTASAAYVTARLIPNFGSNGSIRATGAEVSRGRRPLTRNFGRNGSIRATGAEVCGGRRGPGAAGLARAAVPAGLLGAYATTMGRAGMRAVREPSPQRLQGLVGAGVLGLMPLEGALIAAAGRRRPRMAMAGAAVAALWPLARSLARRRAVT